MSDIWFGNLHLDRRYIRRDISAIHPWVSFLTFLSGDPPPRRHARHFLSGIYLPARIQWRVLLVGKYGLRSQKVNRGFSQWLGRSG